MLRAIRSRVRFTPATGIAALALVFAMSGGAWAAGKYLITSTKQIKPSVLASLKGAAGKAGKAGPAGALGPAGAQGPAGPGGAQGAKGENGVNGKEGAQGKEGPAGKEGPKGATGATGPEGSPWTAGGFLPSGKTETGLWTAYGDPILPERHVDVAISFPIPLSPLAVPGKAFIFTIEQIAQKKNIPSGCTGTVENPTAPAGTLCIYPVGERLENVEIPTVKDIINGQSGYSSTGTVLDFVTEKASPEQPAIMEVTGSWAVTAP